MEPEERISEGISLGITGARGFTLLELLLAFSVLTVVLAIAMGGLGLSYKVWSKSGERMEGLDRHRVIAGLIGQEVSSIFAFSEGSPLAKQVAFVGQEDSLSFVATNPATGFKEVMLYVDQDPATPESGLILRQDLVPHGTLFSSGKGRVVELDKTIARLRLRYYNEKLLSDGAIEGEWLSRWPPEGQAGEAEQVPSRLPLPKAVEVTLVSAEQLTIFPSEVILIRRNMEISQFKGPMAQAPDRLRDLIRRNMEISRFRGGRRTGLRR